MKILHATGQRPEKTGSGVYLQAIMKESARKGHDNFLFAGVPLHKKPALPGIHRSKCMFVTFESENLPFPVTGMSDVMPYKSTLFKKLKGTRLKQYNKAFSQKLYDAVTTFKPDIIHTHHLFQMTALACRIAPDIPIVTTCHSTELRQYKQCPHLRDFVRQECRKLDHVMALTRTQKKEITETLGIDHQSITVTGGGYDDTLFYTGSKPSPNPVVILYAGKLNRPKGVPDLLKALSRIKQRPWILHIAGTGTGKEAQECIRLAEAFKEKVIIHGHVTHHTLSELMKNSHIQIMPSYFEGLPLVLFEGLASGCRLVANNLSGFQETFGNIDPDVVRLIDLPPLETIDAPFLKDREAIELKLSDAISHMIDKVKEQPDFHSPEAQKVATEFTWKNIFKHIESVYKHAVNV